jgi:hypothetical protein
MFKVISKFADLYNEQLEFWREIMKFLILTLFCSFVIHATIVVPLSEDQVINSSNLVIYGEVVDKESNWATGGKKIVTDFKVKVEEFFYPCDSYSSDDKCQVNESLSTSVAKKTSMVGGGRYVYVRTLGGSVAGVSMKVAGSPQFKLGTKLMFLLRELATSSTDFTYRVVGFSQGVCTITKSTSGEDQMSCVYDKLKKHNDKNTPLSVKGSKMSSGDNVGVRKSMKGFKSKLHMKGKGRK